MSEHAHAVKDPRAPIGSLWEPKRGNNQEGARVRVVDTFAFALPDMPQEPRVTVRMVHPPQDTFVMALGVLLSGKRYKRVTKPRRGASA